MHDEKKLIRIICQQTSASAAVHVGGPTATDYLTFEIEAPQVVDWFRAQWDSIGHKSIVGVEVVTPKDSPHD